MRLLAVALVLGAAAGCSSSSSGGSTVTSPTASSSPTSRAAQVDEALHRVLSGLHTATAAAATASIRADGQALESAGVQLRGASLEVAAIDALPAAVRTPVISGLDRVSGLLRQAGGCLVGQSGALHPRTTRCVPPLRQAQAKGAAIAHALISLSAYGSTSPAVFEARLVAALRGGK